MQNREHQGRLLALVTLSSTCGNEMYVPAELSPQSSRRGPANSHPVTEPNTAQYFEGLGKEKEETMREASLALSLVLF